MMSRNTRWIATASRALIYMSLWVAGVSGCTKEDPVESVREELRRSSYRPGNAYTRLKAHVNNPAALDLVEGRIKTEDSPQTVKLAEALAHHAGCDLSISNSGHRPCQEAQIRDLEGKPLSSEHQQRARELLRKALKEGKPRLRHGAALVLGYMGDEAVAPELVRQLGLITSKRHRTSEELTNTPATIRGDDLVDSSHARFDEAYLFEWEEGWALSRVGKSVRKELQSLLTQKSTYVTARMDAAVALGIVGGDAAVEALSQEFSTLGMTRAAIFALGVTRSERAVAPLLASMKRVPKYRKQVCQALAKIGDSKVADSVFAGGVLFSWEEGPDGLKCLQSLEWQPKNDKQRVYKLIAQRDEEGLNQDFATTKRVLMEEIGQGDADSIRSALFTFIGLAKEEVIEELVSKLDRHPNNEQGKKIANGYLNAGSPKLAVAAARWALKYGYEFQKSREKPAVSWGKL